MPLRKRSNPAADRTADALHSAAIHLLRRLRRLDDKAGLPAAQLSALSVIVFAGPLTLGDLAKAEQIRPASVTQLVRQLETAGVVRKTADENDARRTILTATSKGKAVLQSGRGRRVRALASYVSTLDKADRDLLKRAAELMEAFATHETDEA